MEKPELTQEEKDKAIEIALKDEHVQELLQSRNYTIQDDHITATHEGQEKTGADVVICFDRVYSIDYNWPRWDPERHERLYYHSTVPVKRMGIAVDFRTEKVRQIVAWPLGPEEAK